MISFRRHILGGTDIEAHWDKMQLRILSLRGKPETVLGRGNSARRAASKILLRLRREGLVCLWDRKESGVARE